MKYYVLIKEVKSDQIESRMGPMSEDRAHRVAAGANINLNHDRFHTDVVFADEGEVE